MERYGVRYIHKISPQERDVEPDLIELPGNAFSNRTNLARALRNVGVLGAGERLRNFRVEGDRVIAFPAGRSIWHSIILGHDHIPRWHGK